MLERLDSRATAVLAAILAIIVSVFLGANLSLGRARSNAAELFYNGIDGDGFGINYYLHEISGASANLVTVAKRHADESNPLLVQLEAARAQLQEADTPGQKYAAAQKLRASVEQMDAYLQTLELDDYDANYHSKLVVNIDSYYRIISSDPYNQYAARYNQSLKAFPANMLARMTGNKELELYS